LALQSVRVSKHIYYWNNTFRQRLARLPSATLWAKSPACSTRQQAEPPSPTSPFPASAAMTAQATSWPLPPPFPTPAPATAARPTISTTTANPSTRRRVAASSPRRPAPATQGPKTTCMISQPPDSRAAAPAPATRPASLRGQITPTTPTISSWAKATTATATRPTTIPKR